MWLIFLGWNIWSQVSEVGQLHNDGKQFSELEVRQLNIS